MGLSNKKGLSRREAGWLGHLASLKGIAKAKQKRRKEYTQDPKYCLQCKHVLKYEKKNHKFCSQSCSGKFSSTGRKRSKSRKTDNCLNCNDSLIGKAGKKYCNISCQHEHKWNKTKELIEQKSTTITARVMKRYILETKGSRCEICGKTKWNSKSIPLELDHIDGNAENNKLDNLRIICPNCHAQTSTYKSKNNGHGRHKRKERYRQGLSY